jgi:hypothetical protein
MINKLKERIINEAKDLFIDMNGVAKEITTKES